MVFIKKMGNRSIFKEELKNILNVIVYKNRFYSMIYIRNGWLIVGQPINKLFILMNSFFI